jgi:hypothetical protein
MQKVCVGLLAGWQQPSAVCVKARVLYGNSSHCKSCTYYVACFPASRAGHCIRLANCYSYTAVWAGVLPCYACNRTILYVHVACFCPVNVRTRACWLRPNAGWPPDAHRH